MKQLTLQHLAAYYPFKLMWETTNINGEKRYETMVGLFEELICLSPSGDFWFDGENDFHAKPLLRPLDQLTQPINEGGREFVPLHEINSIICPKRPLDKDFDFEIYADRVAYFNIHVATQVAELLDKWHFDWRYNLIKSGLALPLDSINDKTGKE